MLVRRPVAFTVVLLAGLGVGCATSPARGELELSLVSESQNIAPGREAARQVQENRGGQQTMMQWKTVTCAVAALALMVAGCGETATDDRADESVIERGTTGTAPEDDNSVGTAGTTGTVRLADIAADPDQFIGRQVTVVADVEEVLGPNAFALDEDAPLGGGLDRDVIVLSRKAASLESIDDQWIDNEVRVRGTVEKMTVDEAERELGMDLDPAIETELESASAVIVADSVERTDARSGSIGTSPTDADESRQ